MYDNLKKELEEIRLKATERGEKVDYYRKTLENERALREQADKQAIDLLNDIKTRYDNKLSGYMAKNKNQQNDKKVASNKKGCNGPTGKQKKVDTWDNTPADEDKEGNTNEDSWDNSPTEEAKGDAQNYNPWNTPTTEAEENTANNNPWASSPTEDVEKDTANDNPWSNQTTTDDKNGESWAATNMGDEWGNNETSNNNTWDDKSTTNKNDKPASNKKDKSTTNKNDKSTTNKKDKPSSSKKDKPTTNKSDKTPTSKNDSPRTNSETKEDSNKTEPKETTTVAEKVKDLDYNEMKSQLLTAKLDLRLLDRDKAKLSGELAAVKKERDELYKKLEASNQSNSALESKIKDVTVDLISANGEIRKLNQRLDEVDNERKNKDRDASIGEIRRKNMEAKFKSLQQQIADLQSQCNSLKEENEDHESTIERLTRRNERLETDLNHNQKLIRTLKDGCTLVEGQAKTFEVRHDTVILSKQDLERELIAIKEESSRHITTINKLQKSNEQVSKAFLLSMEAHEQCKNELEKLQQEYGRRLESFKLENLRLSEANSQLRKLMEYLQKSKK